jgi:hypothetical protein
MVEYKKTIKTEALKMPLTIHFFKCRNIFQVSQNSYKITDTLNIGA